MAEKRIPYNWENVEAGDIISFRYPSKGSTKLHSILVLGKNIEYKKNDGTKSSHLAGMKVEMSNNPLVSPASLLQNLKNAGDIVLVEKVTPIEYIDFQNPIIINAEV